jgi:hypothetical protein
MDGCGGRGGRVPNGTRVQPSYSSACVCRPVVADGRENLLIGCAVPCRRSRTQVPGMSWFKDAKFGLFVHNGPVTQWGTEISFPLVCTKLPCDVAEKDGVRKTINTTDELAAHRRAYADLAKTCVGYRTA